MPHQGPPGLPVSCAGAAAAQCPDGRGLMTTTRDDTAITWPAVSSAVALVTSLRARSGDSQADLISDAEPGQVVAALTVVSTVLLEALAPDSRGDVFLELLGLAALENSARLP